MLVFKGCWWTFIFNPQSALVRWLHSLCVFIATGRRRGGLHTQLHWLSGESSEGSAMPKSTRVVREIQAQDGNLKRFDPVSLFLQSKHFPLTSFLSPLLFFYPLSTFSSIHSFLPSFTPPWSRFCSLLVAFFTSTTSHFLLFSLLFTNLHQGASRPLLIDPWFKQKKLTQTNLRKKKTKDPSP